MIPQQLVTVAQERGMPLGEAVAATMLAQRGPAAAVEHVEAAATLIDLASALGFDLARLAATRLLDRHDGVYEAARDDLIRTHQARRDRAFSVEYNRCERRYRSKDARARHAVLMGDLATGTLGYQAAMLLVAAEDAGLEHDEKRGLLDADGYRKRLVDLVALTVAVRYPVRKEPPWSVIRHGVDLYGERVRAEIKEEREARDVVWDERASLRSKIDRIHTKRLQSDVNKVLVSIRKRLAKRAEEGWRADPERYRREVLEAAARAVA